MPKEGEIPFDELKEIIEHAVEPNFEELRKNGRRKLNVMDFCELWAKALHLEVTCHRKAEEFKGYHRLTVEEEVSWYLDYSIHCGGNSEMRTLYKSFLTEPLIKIWDLFYARREGLSFLIFDGEACIRLFDRSVPVVWIILKAETFRKGEAYLNLVLFHEIAHYLLNFTDVNSLESQKRQEEEADFLAATWCLTPSL